MPKNIVILLDGTSNEISNKRSNVLRLYGALEKDAGQLVYYDPGVGTFGADNAWSRTYRRAYEVWGLATGWGFDANILGAYRFLVENYANGQSFTRADRDRIYLFGFPRGAYAARVLAGFLNAFGLMEPRNLNLLIYAYRAFKNIGEHTDRDTATVEDHSASDGVGENPEFAEMGLYERILRPDRPPIRLLGLFDTVSSVIESGRYGPRLRSHAFTSRNPSVESVRHALAIDERRRMFRPRLWTPGQTYFGNPFGTGAGRPQDLREVWFSGVHGDVGGGYPQQESALAKLSLQWMIEQASATGLRFDKKQVDRTVFGTGSNGRYVPPDPLAAMHDSMSTAWRLLEIPQSRPRFIPEGARLHWSVIERVEKLGTPPVNLPRTFETEGSPPG